MILRMTKSPFIVGCYATFNDARHLSFLLEPVMGGELFTVYARHKLHGSATHARFYVANVLRALEHLHQRHVIYRDLKPENLMVDERGYLKVCDFGLAVCVMGHAYTTCGTPEYFAPEIVVGAGYSAAVDWWTLGVFAYELMTGVTPFVANNPLQIFRKVRGGIEKADFPASNCAWKALVCGLCRLDPSERLPVRAGGVDNAINNHWFSDAKFDWDTLTIREMKAPHLPKIKAMDDLTNFDVVPQKLKEVPYKDPGNEWDKEFQDVWGPDKF